jgi:hypothetical protein
MTGHETPPASNRKDHPKALAPSTLLGLAAAPAFAAMAVLTMAAGGQTDTCMGQAGTSLTGMAPMYLLMSVFHMAPWLRHAGRLNSGRRSRPMRQ